LSGRSERYRRAVDSERGGFTKTQKVSQVLGFETYLGFNVLGEGLEEVKECVHFKEKRRRGACGTRM